MSGEGYLVLEDGTVYEGEPFGTPGSTFGEVVFNTSMTGYQEMLTDPSYAGQIVMPTYPLIGNYGVNTQDVESRRIQVAGFVVREHSEHPSHYESTGTLNDYLASEGVQGLSGVDTRAVTLHIRRKTLVTRDEVNRDIHCNQMFSHGHGFIVTGFIDDQCTGRIDLSTGKEIITGHHMRQIHTFNWISRVGQLHTVQAGFCSSRQDHVIRCKIDDFLCRHIG